MSFFDTAVVAPEPAIGQSPNTEPSGLVVPEYDPDADTFAAACAYANAGMYVVPIRQGTKNPGSVVGDDWQAKSTTDTKVLMEHMGGSSLGIALHVGRSGLVAIDVDHPERVPEILQRAIDELHPPFHRSRPDNPLQGHYLFATPPGRRFSNSTGKLGTGWGEIRGTNGAIILAPTIHEDAKDGAHYEWVRTGSVPYLPDYIADLLTDATDATDAATDAVVSAFLDEHTGNERPDLLNVWVAIFEKDVKAGKSRHDSMVSKLTGAMKEARAGYYPARLAVDRLRQAFTAAVTDTRRDGTRKPHEVTSEWSGLLAWAVAQAEVADLDEVHRRVDDKAPDVDKFATTSFPPRTDPETGQILDVAVPDSYTDAHIAEALAGALKGQWLYVDQWKRWLRWDGRRWAQDRTEGIYEVARQWAIELVVTVARMGASKEDVGRAASYRNRAKIDAALTMARRIEGVAAEANSFDLHPDLLTVGNGTVNLRTGELLAHDPTHRITKLAGGDYAPGLTHPDVDKVLAVVNPGVLDYLQRLVGYAATGHNHEALVPVFDGGGGNGKTTFLEASGAALGDHAGPVSPRLVMKGAHESHPTMLASLQGLRLATLVETEEGGALRLEQVKAITGGDTITARYMYGDFFTFEPSHLLVIATNHRPLVNSTERAAWRRLRLVKFPFTYKAADEANEAVGDRIIDPWLMQRLRSNEQARNAMLTWIIDGARQWYSDGIGSCAEVDAATDEWRRDEDVIGRFHSDRLKFGPGASIRGAALYDEYKMWCVDEGRPAKSNKNFASDFMAHEDVIAAGVERVMPQGSALYKGVSSR